MKTYFTILIFSSSVVFLLTPIIRRFALEFGAVDRPDSRKVHKRLMPRLGGVAVFLGFCSPWIFFYLFENRVSLIFLEYEKMFYALAMCSFFMLLLGIYDDFKGANAFKKLGFQLGAACILYSFGYRIESLSNPFGTEWGLGMASMPLTLLWIIGITNAMNLLDGIDGLAVGVTASIALVLSAINILEGQTVVALFSLCLAGACLGFLPYNFSPARIFLGDSGSLFLGLVLACVSILSSYKAATATFVSMPIYMVFLFGLPLIDTTSVFIGRLIQGRSVFKADMTHVHHRLLAFGWTQKQAAYILYSCSIVFGLLSMAMSLKSSPYLIMIGGLFVSVILGVIYRSEQHTRRHR